MNSEQTWRFCGVEGLEAKCGNPSPVYLCKLGISPLKFVFEGEFCFVH